ncbi:hypothetical protein C4569_01785 [Candidatus Parcubacteria bacterium]|nr:MAG: hypothetical protein C4569_01785 [Candidatus Parcubacteria bacterium]
MTEKDQNITVFNSLSIKEYVFFSFLPFALIVGGLYCHKFLLIFFGLILEGLYTFCFILSQITRKKPLFYDHENGKWSFNIIRHFIGLLLK